MRFESGHFYLPADAPWLADFSQELFSFPETRYDDQVDAVMMALEELLECEDAELCCEGVRLVLLTREEPFLPDFSKRG